MPTLFLKCRSCGVDFPTPIALTEEGHRGNFMISGLTHACPSCGAVDQFYTADYFVQPEVTQAAPEGAVAVLSGDQAAVAQTELDTLAGRLAGFGVEGGPPTRTAQPPATGDTPISG